MNKFQSAVMALILAGSAHGATLSGKVVFTEAVPKEAEIKMASDPVCAKEHAGQKVYKEDVVVNSNKTLANVFVYVKEGVKKESVPPVDATPVKFDQRGCMYHPHVFGIRVGQKLQIINSDPILHNVHSLAKSNAQFNNGMATKGQVIEKTFTKPEMNVKIKCDVHGWMNARAFVMDNPYFAITDNQGNFTINNLPPGDYTVEAVQEKLGDKDEKVTLTDAGKSIEFKY